MERERRKNFIFSSFSLLKGGCFLRKIENFSQKTTLLNCYKIKINGWMAGWLYG